MAFTDIPTASAPVTLAGTGGGYGGFLGSSAGGAFAGGLVGGLVGDALFPGGFRGRGGCFDGGCGGERVVQINAADGHHRDGWGGCGPWELFKEMSDDRREQVEQTVSLQHDLFGIQKDILASGLGARNTALEQTIAFNERLANMAAEAAECCCENKVLGLQNKFDLATQIAATAREAAECCCRTNENILRMGFETQLRDQTNQGAILKELAEIKCQIKEGEKDEIIRNQAEKIAGLQENATRGLLSGAIRDSFDKTVSALNQLGVNQVNTDPATSKWPPFVPSFIF